MRDRQGQYFFRKYSVSAVAATRLRDHGRGRTRRWAFVTGGIYSLNKVAVEGSAAHVAIDVAGSGDARSNRLESPVELTAINVIAGYGHAGLWIRRVPLQENAVRLPAGRHPEQHHADDPEKKDHQDRNRPAGGSSQTSLIDRVNY